MKTRSCFRAVWWAVALTALMACEGRGDEARSAPAGAWVRTWTAAQQLTELRNLPPQPGLSGNTLRQVIRGSIGGKRIRVHFSNQFGKEPVEVHSARIALVAGPGAIKPATDRALRFGGETSVKIPAGQEITSDPLDFELAPLGEVAVSLHLDSVPAEITGHPGSRSTSYLQTGDAVSAPDLASAVKTVHWYLLSALDVESAEGAAIAILGDSITDGRGSTTDGNNRWPDQLAKRLQANPSTTSIAVLNQGIGGNAVVTGGLGPTALTRFERDVLAPPGVRWVIVFEGVNDIGGSRSPAVATNLITAYERFIDQAHARHLRVYGVPILPFGGSMYFSQAHEAARQTVNAWIRTSGKFDAVIDMDAAVRDPENPSKLLPACDSGDHLHPGVGGYQRMAEVIDLKLFGR